MKKNKVLKVLLAVFILIVVLILGYVMLGLKKINDSKKQTQEFVEEYNQLVETKKVSYVMIEINPKAILEVVDNKITNMGCLNSDCERIFNFDVTGKSLNETIKMLYEKAKENGVDVSNGVQVSSINNKIKKVVSDIEYVNYNSITKEEEDDILNQVKDNEEISNNKLEKEYNEKLLELYEKDPDYGSVYTCDNIADKLVCYITEEFENNLPTEISLLNRLYYNERHQKLMNVLDKFNIEYESSLSDVEGLDTFKTNEVKAIKIVDVMHQVGVSYYAGDNFESNFANCFNIVLESTLESGEYGYSYKTLPLSKFELISKSYNQNDIVVLKNYNSMTLSPIQDNPEA